MNNHIIVSGTNICMCGVYAGRTITCRDVIASMNVLNDARSGLGSQTAKAINILGEMIAPRVVDRGQFDTFQQQCLPPDGIHDDPPDTRPRCPICNCPAYKSLDGILKCPSNTCGWGKTNDSGMLPKICPQCERANTLTANVCQWCGWVPGKPESTNEISGDSNVESVRAKLLERSKAGLEKYGVTTERQDVTLAGWLKHQQEELMDAAVYAEAAIKKLSDLYIKAGDLCQIIEGLPAGEAQTKASVAASNLMRDIGDL